MKPINLVVLCVGLLWISTSHASRALLPPAISHDLHLPPQSATYAAGWGPTNWSFYSRVYTLNLRNLSSVASQQKQTITVEVQPALISFKCYGISPGMFDLSSGVLIKRVNSDNVFDFTGPWATQSASSSTPITMTFVLNPEESRNEGLMLIYVPPSGVSFSSVCAAGTPSTLFRGELRLKITVAEDKGAISGSISVLGSSATGTLLETPSVTGAYTNLMIPLNGGRPF